MTTTKNFLAIDLGAESGRTIVGSLQGSKLEISETHRFPNIPNKTPGGLRWDIDKLWTEILNGLKISSEKFSLSSIGIDTWGVDFALLNKEGNLIEPPFHYRDKRTDGVMEEVFAKVPREKVYDFTGIQFLQFNTLYQLYSLVQHNPAILSEAHTFLTIPDLINYWLTGKKCCEFTNATTTQCFNPQTKEWAFDLLSSLDIPPAIFPDVIQPGQILGPIVSDAVKGSNLSGIAVVVPACHDTGSAVAAVPAENEDFAWLSSGTWSIFGMETKSPYLNQVALENSFTNEGGVNGTWRFSKNIMGLWIIQECKREWDISYQEIMELAQSAQPFLAVIDPDFEDFFQPGGMTQKIQNYCKRTKQIIPQTQGEIARVVLESLALKYRYVLEKLELISGKFLNPIHIIGGGTKNTLLNQFTAECTGRTVVTGPTEATAIGNILMQAVALGAVSNLQEARAIVKQSFSSTTYTAQQDENWNTAYKTLQNLLLEN